MVKSAGEVGLESIERLETKVKRLIDYAQQLRDERDALGEENRRLRDELEAARQRAGEAEGATAVLDALRAEREHVRARVAEMLDQLEGLEI